jgi:hypothetical protein
MPLSDAKSTVIAINHSNGFQVDGNPEAVIPRL